MATLPIIQQWFRDNLDDREEFNLQTDAKTYSLARVVEDIATQVDSGISPSGLAGGDLGGAYPEPSVIKLQGYPVNSTLPIAGQILRVVGGEWAPAALTTPTLADIGFEIVGFTGTGVNQDVAHTLGVIPSAVIPVFLTIPSTPCSMSLSGLTSTKVTINATLASDGYVVFIK